MLWFCVVVRYGGILRRIERVIDIDYFAFAPLSLLSRFLGLSLSFSSVLRRPWRKRAEKGDYGARRLGRRKATRDSQHESHREGTKEGV